MKYIRTKNFIHDSKDVMVVNENGTLVVLRGIDKNFVERTRGKTWNTGTNVVLAQADTVEELCDCKIVILKNGEHLQLTMPAKDIAEMAYYKEIYGAIWVEGEHGEPILKAVTKPMNEKGELELI